MRAAATKAQHRKVKKVTNEKKDRSLAVIELEQRKYKTFIGGIISINNIIDEQKLKKGEFSSKVLEKETKLDKYIFRPDGNKKVIWDIWISLLILYSIIAIPLRIGFQIQSNLDAKIFDYIVDCFFFLDILTNFNTAVSETNEKLVGNRKVIAFRYFQFWFWLDMVSTIPIDTFVELALQSDNGNALTAIRLIRIIRLVRLLKLVRVFRLRNLAEHLESLHINPAIMNVFKLIFQIFFIAHIVSCFWYFLTTGDVVGYNDITGETQSIPTWISTHPEIQNGDLGTRYVASLFWTVATMVAVGYGDFHAENVHERIYSIVVMLGGGILFGAIIGETTRLLEGRNPQAKLIKEKMNNLKGYLAEKALPLELKKEAKVAYTYYLQKNTSFGEQILNDLPFNLLEKLVYKIFEREIACVKLFQTSDKLFVIRLVQFCQPMHSSIGDILYDFGDVTNEFVFIMKGLVSISTIESKNVSILAGYATEGNYFMDFEYLMNTLSLARYKAVEQSNLFVIKYTAMAEACGDFIESGIAFKEELVRRYKCFKNIVQSDTKETIVSNQNSFLGVFSEARPNQSSVIDYSRSLFWIDGFPKQTFDRHQSYQDMLFFSENKDTSKLRIIVHGISANYEVIEIPRNELIHRYVINPDGRMKVRWDTIMGIFIVYSVLYIPVQIAFDDPATITMKNFDHVMDAFFLSDIILSGRTAYYDGAEDAYMVEPLKIYNHYMKTWFLVDFFSGVPFDSIVSASVLNSESNLNSLRLIKVVRLIRLLKLARLFKLSKYLYKLEDSLDIPPSLFELLVLCLRVLMLGHFLACLWWGTTSAMSTDPWFEQTDFQPVGSTFTTCGTGEKYVASLYWTFTTLATVGYGDYIASNTGERLLNIFIMLIGATTFGYIVANVSSTFGSLNQTQVLKREKMSNITSILAEKGISDNLSTSIINHFKNLYKRISAYDEEAILAGLPRQISDKIAITIHKETMEKISIFKFIDNQSVALHIFNILQPSNFQYGQVLVKEDTAALEIVFLLSGKAIACKKLQDSDKRCYMFDWNTQIANKTNIIKVDPINRNLTEEQHLKLAASKKSTISKKMSREHINDNIRHLSYATPIDEDSINKHSDTDTKTDEMISVVKISADEDLDDSVHSYHSVNNLNKNSKNDIDDDSKTSFFGKSTIHVNASSQSNDVSFKYEDIINIGYEPVAQYSAGDFFGHAALLKGTNYHASVVALCACNTYTLRKSEIVKLVINNPPISMILQSAIGKAMNALRHSRGKEMVRQDRAIFLTSVKEKHIYNRNKRKQVEAAIQRRSSKSKSIMGAPLRRLSLKNIKILPISGPRYKSSKWEIVRKAVRTAKATSILSRVADNMHQSNDGLSTLRRDDHFKRSLNHRFGVSLDAILNETSMQYDSESSDDEKKCISKVSEAIHKSESSVRIRTRTSSFSAQNKGSSDNANKQVNLQKLKKTALLKKCRSESKFDYDYEDLSSLKSSKVIRRSSFPSYDMNEWRNNRIDKSII